MSESSIAGNEFEMNLTSNSFQTTTGVNFPVALTKVKFFVMTKKEEEEEENKRGFPYPF